MFAYGFIYLLFSVFFLLTTKGFIVARNKYRILLVTYCRIRKGVLFLSFHYFLNVKVYFTLQNKHATFLSWDRACNKLAIGTQKITVLSWKWMQNYRHSLSLQKMYEMKKSKPMLQIKCLSGTVHSVGVKYQSALKPLSLTIPEW